VRNPKSEGRRPKEIRNPKSEARNRKSGKSCRRGQGGCFFAWGGLIGHNWLKMLRAHVCSWEPVSLGSPFPLTPALSPREREQPGPALDHSHAAGFAGRPAKTLSLAEGEGRGEGERDARNGARAQERTCARPGARQTGTVARFESCGLCRNHTQRFSHSWGREIKCSIGCIGCIGYFFDG